MKTANFNALFFLIAFISMNGSLHAASSGGENGSQLTWYCEVLAVKFPPQPGLRETFCRANSPDASLRTLEIRSSITAASAYHSGCSAFDNYVGYLDDDYSTPFGTTQQLFIMWNHNIADFSFNAYIAPGGEWTFLQYTPPSPPGGSASVGPFANTSGLCF